MDPLSIIALLVKAAPIVTGAWENREEIESVVKSVFGVVTKFNDDELTEAEYLETDAKLDAAIDKFMSLKRPG